MYDQRVSSTSNSPPDQRLNNSNNLAQNLNNLHGIQHQQINGETHGLGLGALQGAHNGGTQELMVLEDGGSLRTSRGLKSGENGLIRLAQAAEGASSRLNNHSIDGLRGNNVESMIVQTDGSGPGAGGLGLRGPDDSLSGGALGLRGSDPGGAPLQNGLHTLDNDLLGSLLEGIQQGNGLTQPVVNGLGTVQGLKVLETIEQQQQQGAVDWNSLSSTDSFQAPGSAGIPNHSLLQQIQQQQQQHPLQQQLSPTQQHHLQNQLSPHQQQHLQQQLSPTQQQNHLQQLQVHINADDSVNFTDPNTTPVGAYPSNSHFNSLQITNCANHGEALPSLQARPHSQGGTFWGSPTHQNPHSSQQSPMSLLSSAAPSNSPTLSNTSRGSGDYLSPPSHGAGGGAEYFRPQGLVPSQQQPLHPDEMNSDDEMDSSFSSRPTSTTPDDASPKKSKKKGTFASKLVGYFLCRRMQPEIWQCFVGDFLVWCGLSVFAMDMCQTEEFLFACHSAQVCASIVVLSANACVS